MHVIRVLLISSFYWLSLLKSNWYHAQWLFNATLISIYFKKSLYRGYKFVLCWP